MAVGMIFKDKIKHFSKSCLNFEVTTKNDVPGTAGSELKYQNNNCIGFFFLSDEYFPCKIVETIPIVMFL